MEQALSWTNYNCLKEKNAKLNTRLILCRPMFVKAQIAKIYCMTHSDTIFSFGKLCYKNSKY